MKIILDILGIVEYLVVCAFILRTHKCIKFEIVFDFDKIDKIMLAVQWARLSTTSVFPCTAVQLIDSMGVMQ